MNLDVWWQFTFQTLHATSQDGSSLDFVAATAGKECNIQDARSRGLWQCDVWCVMCDVPGLFCCKIMTLWRPQIPHLDSFRIFYWCSKIDPGCQLYIDFILQGFYGMILKWWKYVLTIEVWETKYFKRAPKFVAWDKI